MNSNFKDLRKAAFAVGFGLTVGKAVGGMVEAVLNGMVISVTKAAAKHGNKTAQEVLQKPESSSKVKTKIR